jgi:hypothetical protein
VVRPRYEKLAHGTRPMYLSIDDNSRRLVNMGVCQGSRGAGKEASKGGISRRRKNISVCL